MRTFYQMHVTLQQLENAVLSDKLKHVFRLYPKPRYIFEVNLFFLFLKCVFSTYKILVPVRQYRAKLYVIDFSNYIFFGIHPYIFFNILQHVHHLGLIKDIHAHFHPCLHISTLDVQGQRSVQQKTPICDDMVVERTFL